MLGNVNDGGAAAEGVFDRGRGLGGRGRAIAV